MHTNRGYIELLDGQHFVTAGDLANDGGMILYHGSDLRLGADGTSTLTIAEGQSVAMQGTATIHGNVINAGALVPNDDMRLDPLPSPPVIHGDLEQRPFGLLYAAPRKLNGVLESLYLTVTGHAALAGHFVGGFSDPSYRRPSAGDRFVILRYGSYDGSLAPYGSLDPYQPRLLMEGTLAWIRFGQPILQVTSEPDDGVSVGLDPAPATGGTPGVTPCERAYDWSMVITLTAPAVAEGRPFLHWEDDQGAVLGNHPTLAVTLDGNMEVVAVYDPDPLVPGDPRGRFQLIYRDQTGFNLRGIWDLTGQYSGAVGPYALALDLVHGEKGTLTGTGRLQGTVGGQAFDVAGMTVKGRIKGKAGVVIAKASLAGAGGSATVSLKLALTLDPGALTLHGAVSGKIADAVGGSAAANSAVVLPLPAGMDGTYQLPSELIPDARGTIGGNGTLTLANGRTVALLAKGKCAGGVTTLHFAGDKLADPAFAAVKLRSLVTTYTNGTAHIEAISGKALGQSLKWRSEGKSTTILLRRTAPATHCLPHPLPRTSGALAH